MRLADADGQARHFDALYRQDVDPWRTRTRWYERRKRALTLAVLPAERYARACEPGCGAGETTLALARRCDQVVASDASAAAVRQARRRLAGSPHVTIAQARMPEDWPAGPFDLVVLSELGYYLPEDDLARLADKCRHALIAGGALVACHWRHPEPDLRRSAHDVHALLHARTGLHRAAHYEDADFLLDAWTLDDRSVARREGLA